MDVKQVLNSFLGSPGIYLHVPFCQSLCPFCPFEAREVNLIQEALSVLDRETAVLVEQA
jgi:coproporphyrinogen III oxidase-like Fe-S oxidoreductase